MRNPLRSHLAGALDPVLLAKDLQLDPDPWQEKMMRSNRRRRHVLVHRQGGKTTTTAVIALHEALYVPNSLVLVISPSLRQSQELFRRVLAFYRQRGKPVPPETENQLSLVLENGSRVIASPASEGTIRGYSVNLLIIDEGARVSDEVFASVLPMVAVTRGKVIALSTPAGRRGWFYQASHSLKWEHFKVTGDECPRLSAAELEEEREILGDLAFRQEYGVEFVDSAGAAFSGDDVDALFGGLAPPRAARAERSPRPDPAVARVQRQIAAARGRPARIRAAQQRACPHFWRRRADGSYVCVGGPNGSIGCGLVKETR